MATDRSPYVCIGDSLLDEPWPYEVKCALTLLSCHMHMRWRADRRLSLEDVARRHPVSKSDLEKITGKRRADVALTSLERLADVASMSFERLGDVVWISWPKWAEYNGTHSRSPGADRAGKPPVMGPSSSATRDPRPSEDKKREQNGAPDAPPPRRCSPRTPAPEELSPAQIQQITAYFTKVSPGYIVPRLPSLIENSLLYYAGTGERFANWAKAVTNNILTRENGRRERAQEPLIPTLAQVLATEKRREAEQAAQKQPELQ